jgi:hypothetical protein
MQGWLRFIATAQVTVAYFWLELKFNMYNRETTTTFISNTSEVCNCGGPVSSIDDITCPGACPACSDACKMVASQVVVDLKFEILLQIGPMIYEAPDVHMQASDEDAAAWHLAKKTIEEMQCATPDPSKCHAR